MRFLANFVVAALIAVAVFVGGYLLLLSLRTAPPVVRAESVVVPKRVTLRNPERLEPPPPHPAAVAMAGTSVTAVPRLLEIDLTGVPASLREGAAGVALFDAGTGAGFRWVPLSETIAVAGGTAAGNYRLTAEAKPGETLVVSFAAAESHARHGYLARRLVTAPMNVRETVQAALDCRLTDTGFALPPGVPHVGPLRLQRVDDPRWLPMPHGDAGFSIDSRRPSRLALGAGTYRLSDPIDPDRRQQFTVPTDRLVVLNDGLAAARSDRR